MLTASPSTPIATASGPLFDSLEQRGGSTELHRGDAVTWLLGLPEHSADLVITDPPYESLEKYRAIGTTTRLKHSKASSNDWFPIFPNARLP
ncbi:MAG TPA: hypothetical protein VKP30_05245, partial [Polyangiaceae bacterium]|nr:hypothetical protein [Polyangiaceae bacterium]